MTKYQEMYADLFRNYQSEKDEEEEMEEDVSPVVATGDYRKKFADVNIFFILLACSNFSTNCEAFLTWKSGEIDFKNCRQ